MIRKKIKIRGGAKITGAINMPRFVDKVLKPAIQNAGDVFVFVQAIKAADKVKQGIKRQLFDHVPLAQSTVEYKKKHGYDPRILMRTRKYVNSIDVFNEPIEKGIAYRVTVPEHAAEKEGTPLHLIARVHEFGTSRTPVRPHYRPVMNNLLSKKKTLEIQLAKEINESIEKAIRKSKVSGL